jgi:type IV secretory pathway TraG/TraD family ATPase VirD4
MAIVVQSKDQTRLSLSEDGSGNIYAKMGAAPALGGFDQRQAEEVSLRGGSDAMVESRRSQPRFMRWLHPYQQSVSKTVRRRALMLAQEMQRLAPDKLLVLRRRLGLLMLDRLVWYRDPWFRRRAGEPPEMPPLDARVERDTPMSVTAAN